MRAQSERGEHEFGGDWTSRKLDVLARYLKSYTTALRRTPFTKLYIDAFAGTGYRNAPRADGAGEADDARLLPDLAEPEPQKLLDGSARRALATDPPFDGYIFIEQQASRCNELEQLKTEFPNLAASITVLRGDANTEVRALCGEDWRARRAVLFLDPYGMQVEWATIATVAQTKAIDLWLLFPLGIGVNRLLKRSGDIPGAWKERLDRLLGTTDWYEEFYRVETTSDLFGGKADQVIKASTARIGRYFNQRLGSIFAGVAAEPGALRNARNNPLYLLCFAVANDKGKAIALRIANHLLKGLR